MANEGTRPTFTSSQSQPWPGSRFAPTKQTGILYLKGVVASLFVVGFLFLVNVFVPLGATTLARTAATIAILVVGWGAGLVVPLLLRIRAFWPAAAALGLAVPVFVLLGTFALWDIGDRDTLGRILGATWVLVVFALLAAPSFGQFMANRFRTVAAGTCVVLALAALVLALDILGAPVDGRLTETGWRGGLGLFFASLVLLVAPESTRNVVRWMAWAAFAQFALASGIDPWASGDLSGRLNAAGLVLMVVLALAALTAYFIPARADPEAA